MVDNSLKILLLLAAVLAAAACETVRPCDPNCPSDEQLLAEAGALRLTPGQVKMHVAEQTEGWTQGGAFYHADGSLQVVWRKVRYKGSWEVDAEGNLCYELPKWKRRCHFYMRKDDGTYLLDEGRNIGIRPIYAGNRLNELGRGLPTGPQIEADFGKFKQGPL